MASKKKISKTFRFSDETLRRLDKICEKEGRKMTEAIEFMIQEKADYYGIVVLKKKEPGSGAFPYQGGAKYL